VGVVPPVHPAVNTANFKITACTRAKSIMPAAASLLIEPETDIIVRMVDMALQHLKRDNIVDLDPQQRATLVSNLLVILCSDRHAQPVVQTGS
jgi:hypothetical protein